MEGRDVTDTDELVALAREFGFDGQAFRETFEAPETEQETQADYWYSQQAGIRGFPALLAVADGKAAAVTFGYQSWDAIGPALAGWMTEAPVENGAEGGAEHEVDDRPEDGAPNS